VVMLTAARAQCQPPACLTIGSAWVVVNADRRTHVRIASGPESLATAAVVGNPRHGTLLLCDSAPARETLSVTAEPIELPTRDETHQHERDGVVEVAHVVTKRLKWIFREQPIADYGVDGHLEVVSDDDHATGKNIGAQIKSGPHWFSRPAPGGWTFSGKNLKHYNYWLGHSLPIILILHHPTSEKLYWQVVDHTTAKITGKGFKVIVPEANVLDASAKPALEDIARRLGPAALAVYDRSLQVLPWSTVRVLQAVEEVDRTGAARVAQILAEGRAQPRFAAQQVLAAAPSWLVDSTASAELWAATAAYVNAHGEHDLAVDAFDRSACAGGPWAPRRRALAGLTLITAGRRDEARAYLEQAKAGGAVLLADAGLAALTVPADDARQVEVPRSILSATDAEIDAEPAVLNFLAEQRLRAGDVDGAIGFVRRTIQRPGERNAEMRLRLAEMLRRRIQEHAGFGGPDSAEARRHARSALDEFRRWSGPSENALGELLDLEILDGDLATVVDLALPSAAGGAASDREAAAPQIARRGATAALISGRDDALAVFRQALDGDPYLAQLAAQELELRGGELKQRQQAWRYALCTADDDRSRASCILRLAELGVWPIAEADDLLDRSITPEWTYRLAEAVAQAAMGDPDGALPVVRDMAQDRILAAVRLVMLLDRHYGGAAAAKEWLQQYNRWHDALLADVLPEALWTADGVNDTPSLVADLLADSRLSGDARARLRRQLVHHLRERQGWERLIRVCRAGLRERPDAYLAWSLVQALHATHDVPAAREALGQHCPAPDTEQQARLWAQLHIGLDLTHQDAEIAADLAERYREVPGIAAGLTALLRREQHRRRRDGAPEWPQPLLDRIGALSAAVYDGADPDAIAENTVVERLGQIGYQRLEDLRRQVQQGRKPLAALASLAGSPYGKMLLLRTAGMTVATDPESGIAAVGEATARQALDQRMVVVDQSALYVQQLLGRQGELLRMRFAQLHVPASAADDAIRTRDSVWATTATNVVFGVHNGELRREEIAAARRATLRAQSMDLERITTRLTRHDVESSRGPAHDAVELARHLGLALYADDVALRQTARARGVPTFGTTDLITAVGYPMDQAVEMTRLLAAEYVVDLSLSGDDLAYVEPDGEWHGAGLLNISRSQWWKRANAHGINAWRSVALKAAQVSGDNLVLVTKYALQGALQDCPAGQRTQRYQQVVVAALDAVHEGGVPAPHNYFGRLVEVTVAGVAPSPRFVYHSLVGALRERGVDNPHAVAASMLPEMATGA
jgi:tetratricopeptide (TPR) repeat protein